MSDEEKERIIRKLKRRKKKMKSEGFSDSIIKKIRLKIRRLQDE